MTVRVERTIELPADPHRVWEFISDPSNRARAISVVSDFSVDGVEDNAVTWHIDLPIPMMNRTVAVQTRDVEVDPPEFVKFEGRSKVLNVTGEHFISPSDGGSRLRNSFVVEGRLPGVERFFRKNLDEELKNLERTLREDLELDQ
ncbi:MAG TPA: SRPBCC family protein [Natrialbaceae archaeon]|nr:SRPBCC family protein [Natrialbaceae archaeon]